MVVPRLKCIGWVGGMGGGGLMVSFPAISQDLFTRTEKQEVRVPLMGT